MSRLSLVLSLIASCLLSGGCGSIQRRALFHPTHGTHTNGLREWRLEGRLIGYAREVSQPRHVWLFLHGNAGQAADRAYALSVFPPDDAIYILEYPGYGGRDGTPSIASFDAAAQEAYRFLRASFPKTRVGVVSESIGSGPACRLASEPTPPDKLVLIVPFDRLGRVAQVHAGKLAARLVIGGAWNNLAALVHFAGPIDVFGATADAVIPVDCARTLAASRPQAVFHLVAGGHNDWSQSPEVTVRMPD